MTNSPLVPPSGIQSIVSAVTFAAPVMLSTPVIGAAAAGTAAKPKGEAVIIKDGKPLFGVTFPADWKQKVGENYVSAASKDGQAYAMLATLSDADKQAGIKKVKAGLDNYLKGIKFDDQSETKGGALIVTGTGTAKKAGVEVVFAVGVFEAAKGQLVGAAFVEARRPAEG